MTDSIRHSIIDALDTRFKAIKTTTYKTDLGNNIFSWRDLEKNPFQISELPGLNYKDVMVEHEPLTFEETLDTMSLECEIGVSGSGSAPTLRDCISDIEKAIGTALSVSGFIDIELKSDEMDIEHLENKIMLAKVILQIQYVNTKGNPDA